MSDVFREVDEDLRREKLKGFWQRYSLLIIGAAVLVVIGVAVWVFLQSQREGRAQADGDRLYAAVALQEAGDLEGARAAFTELRNDGSGSYPVLARFHLAEIDAEAGNLQGAISALDAIAGDNTVDRAVRDVATIRAAMLSLDTATYDQLQADLSGLNVEGGSYRFLAMEILAIAAINEHRYPEALAIVQAAGAFQAQMSGAQQERFQDLFELMLTREDFTPTTPAAETPAAPAAPGFDLRAPEPAVPADATPAADTPPAMDLRANPPAVPTIPGAGGVLVPDAGAAPVAPPATP